MKNKILFLLPLFLFTAATQCMEQALVSRQKTLQDIRNDRDEIYKERLNDPATHTTPLDDILFQENWSCNLTTLEKAQTKKPLSLNPNDDNFGLIFNIDWYKRFNFNKYSFLGLATIAIKSERNPNDGLFKDGERKQKLLNKENPIQVPFEQTKEHIQKLFSLGFEPTSRDKYFAILEKWKRCDALLIIKKMCLLRCADNNSIFLAQVPRDVINYISQLMLDTEESLF